MKIISYGGTQLTQVKLYKAMPINRHPVTEHLEQTTRTLNSRSTLKSLTQRAHGKSLQRKSKGEFKTQTVQQ